MDLARRFSGVTRLYGEQGLAKLQASHVVVAGIGGVGSLAESNFNRQVHAIDGNAGKPKVSAMAERIVTINPACHVREIDDFVTPNNLSQIIPTDVNIVLDCTDDAKAKEALAAYCKQQGMLLIMSGSAGGRLDPTRMQVADLAHVKGDKLLAKVRNQLRRNHGFPRAATKGKKPSKFAIDCVFSDEPVIKPNDVCESVEAPKSGLNCAGYGSSVSVTAPFGFAMAQLALNHII